LLTVQHKSTTNEKQEEKDDFLPQKKKRLTISDQPGGNQSKYHLRRIAPVVGIQDLFRSTNDVRINKTDFFEEKLFANTTCFSEKNIDIKQSSGQIVLLNGQCYTLGLGGFAAFNMTKDQKIAICHGNIKKTKTFNTAIKNNKVYPGNITVFT